MSETDVPGYWFPDLSDEDERMPEAPWQAFIQVPGSCHALDGIWFCSEDDCWNFIRTYLVGATEGTP